MKPMPTKPATPESDSLYICPLCGASAVRNLYTPAAWTFWCPKGHEWRYVKRFGTGWKVWDEPEPQ